MTEKPDIKIALFKRINSNIIAIVLIKNFLKPTSSMEYLSKYLIANHHILKKIKSAESCLLVLKSWFILGLVSDLNLTFQ